LTNIGPTLANNIGGIFSKREIANTGAILTVTLDLYC